jgi:hypothetical protein
VVFADVSNGQVIKKLSLGQGEVGGLWGGSEVDNVYIASLG